MDFNVSPEIENFRLRIRDFVENHVIPLEKDSTNFDKYEMLNEDTLQSIRNLGNEAEMASTNC